MFRIFFYALFLILFLSGCHQDQTPRPVSPSPKVKSTPPPAKEDSSPEPNTEFRKLHYVIYEKGRLKWDIYAQKAYIFKNKRIKMEDLKLCANPEKGFCITAQIGDYDPKAQKFTFSGRVILDAGKKGRLFTSVLKYLPQKEALETEAPVTIENEGFLIKGKGFYYDLKSGTMRVFKRTKVKVDA